MCTKNGKSDREPSYDDSDVSMSDSESSSESEDQTAEIEQKPENEESEEEDELIKAILKEREKHRDHPPNIACEDDVVDISFHPSQNILAAATLTGDVYVYKYTNEENTLLSSLETHVKACRDIEFDEEGKFLYSVGKDKAIILTDLGTEKLVRCYSDAHDCPIYCITVLDENLFATGDEDGAVKLWDLRDRDHRAVFSVKHNEDYISDIITNEEQKYLVCSSGDGSLTTIDMHKRKLFVQSMEYDEELNCLGLFRSETKILTCSSKGKMFFFNWNEFGLHSDEFPGPKCSINDMVPITENIVVTACEDGVLRATNLFPHRHLGVVGQHDEAIESVDICKDGTFIASSGYNSDIKFWNIRYFENFETITHKVKHDRRKDMKHNLPSSKQRNVSDFFAGLSG